MFALAQFQNQILTNQKQAFCLYTEETQKRVAKLFSHEETTENVYINGNSMVKKGKMHF